MGIAVFEVGEVKARIRAMSDREEEEDEEVELEVEEKEEDLQVAALKEAQMLLVNEAVRLRGRVKGWEGRTGACQQVLECIEKISALETEINHARVTRDRVEEERGAKMITVEEKKERCLKLEEPAYTLVLKARTG